MDPRLVLAEESNKRLATTLQHYRNWAGQLLARYQMANPDASRPPRRIYVGGLPAGTTEVSHGLQVHARPSPRRPLTRPSLDRSEYTCNGLLTCAGAKACFCNDLTCARPSASLHSMQ